MSIRLSPHYSDQSFTGLLTLDQKISIFEDQIKGWSLDITDQMVNGVKGPNGEIVINPIPESHFAALSVVMSYFDMIGTFKYNLSKPGQARPSFVAGIKDVFPGFANPDPKDAAQVADIIEVLYKKARCGLYHIGQTRERFIVAHFLDGLLEVVPSNFPSNPTDTDIRFSVSTLIKSLKAHFDSYIKELKDPANVKLREDFEANYDENHPQYQNKKPPMPVVDITPSS